MSGEIGITIATHGWIKRNGKRQVHARGWRRDAMERRQKSKILLSNVFRNALLIFLLS